MFLVYASLNWFTKLLTIVLKASGHGRGTALPGLLIEKYFSFAIPYILEKSPYTILITGTNGKTTTRTLLSDILDKEGGVLQNRSGSNLLRGIISEIFNQSDIFGRGNSKYAVFEVEEATIPKLTKLLKPDQIVVTNLYRDQLDAYGEIDRTQKFIQNAIYDSPESHIVLNADDPRVSSIDTSKNKSVHFFGIDDPLKNTFKYEGASTSKEIVTGYKASELKINNDLTTCFIFGKDLVTLKLPGYYHVYNALGAIVSADIIGIDNKKILDSIQKTTPAFGRGEILNVGETRVHLLLVKNPVGFNLNLDLLKFVNRPQIALVLNDNVADGKDVSWIWDSNVEMLSEIKPRTILCSGLRATDMMNRVKYASHDLKSQPDNSSFHVASSDTNVLLLEDLNILLEYIGNSKSSDFYVLSTYTAMLGIRKLITGNSLNV